MQILSCGILRILTRTCAPLRFLWETLTGAAFNLLTFELHLQDAVCHRGGQTWETADWVRNVRGLLKHYCLGAAEQEHLSGHFKIKPATTN